MKQKTKEVRHDLTQGPLGKQILLFSVPLMMSNLLQVLFNMADIAVVGRYAGSVALGAVGSTTTLVTLFTGLLIGLSGGINVVVAHYLGAKKENDTRETVHTAALISLLIGIGILLFGVLFTRRILTIMNTKEELIEGAVLYLRIYFLGMPALAVYNYGNAVFSASGDTRKPLLYLSAAGIINVVLNLFFVIVCKMDVAGVATASIISQYTSAVLIVRALFYCEECFALRLSDLRLHRDKAKMILGLGVPSGLQNGIFQLANLFIQAGVNTFSATMVAGNAAAANADGLVYDAMAAFYTACSSFMGQNRGAGKKDRMLKSYFISLAYAFGTGAVLGILLVISGPAFLGIFTKEPAVIECGMKRLTIMGFSYCISSFMDGAIAASRGIGRSVGPTVIVIMGSCVFRIIWIYTIFAHFRTIESLYLLYVFSWSITAFAEILYFRKRYKQLIWQ
jgi:putative MATE family efflux protein